MNQVNVKQAWLGEIDFYKNIRPQISEFAFLEYNNTVEKTFCDFKDSNGDLYDYKSYQNIRLNEIISNNSSSYLETIIPISVVRPNNKTKLMYQLESIENNKEKTCSFIIGTENGIVLLDKELIKKIKAIINSNKKEVLDGSYIGVDDASFIFKRYLYVDVCSRDIFRFTRKFKYNIINEKQDQYDKVILNLLLPKLEEFGIKINRTENIGYFKIQSNSLNNRLGMINCFSEENEKLLEFAINDRLDYLVIFIEGSSDKYELFLMNKSDISKYCKNNISFPISELKKNHYLFYCEECNYSKEIKVIKVKD